MKYHVTIGLILGLALSDPSFAQSSGAAGSTGSGANSTGSGTMDPANPSSALPPTLDGTNVHQYNKKSSRSRSTGTTTGTTNPSGTPSSSDNSSGNTNSTQGQ